MPVYFVHRCGFGSPTEQFLCRFEFDTVLAWASAVWRRFTNRGEGERYARDLFRGMNVDAVHHVFHPHEEYALAGPPQSMDEVTQWFDALYCECVANGPHHVQVLTEWSDNQRAIYVFDDHYRAANPGKTDFLLRSDWELPVGASSGGAPDLAAEPAASEPGGEGRLYFCENYIGSKYNLDDLEPLRCMAGVRVPDLAQYLLTHTAPDDLDFALFKLRGGLVDVLSRPAGEAVGFLTAIRDQPGEGTHWAAYSDWLQERNLPLAGLHLLEHALRSKACGVVEKNHKPALDLVQVTPHLVQACKHEGCWSDQPKPELTADDTFVRFIFFDDRWAAANPTLAAGILAFASRWDVLT